MEKKYRVTKLFISGIFKGKTHTETLNFIMPVGMKIKKPCAGTSGYIIIDCVEI